MAVTMFMVDAIRFFRELSELDIKKIALEIAILGTKGINPDTKDYRIQSIEQKVFSGYHLLAYYYVSWSLAMPEMLEKLQLPFDKEYETARQLASIQNE